MFAATHHSTEDLLQVLVFLLLLACLGGAAYLVYLKNLSARACCWPSRSSCTSCSCSR
jgi:hypothetical protein